MALAPEPRAVSQTNGGDGNGNAAAYKAKSANGSAAAETAH